MIIILSKIAENIFNLEIQYFRLHDLRRISKQPDKKTIAKKDLTFPCILPKRNQFF